MNTAVSLPLTAPVLKRCYQIVPGEGIPGTPYRVVRHMANGGMGNLYEVVHATLRRRSILKVLREDRVNRADLGERLLSEARILASLGTRGVPAIHDAGVLPDGRPFLIMQKLEGGDLRAELRRHGVLSVPAATRIACDLLSVLTDVHAAGIVHRDVKLDNVFLEREGHVFLLDFGIAKDLRDPVMRTGKHVAFGTPRCMAPEQSGDATVDERTDIYAVGFLLYELLVGRGPFDDAGPSVAAQRFAHLHRLPDPPSRLAPQSIPPALERVVLQALAKRPERRFACADDMLEALRGASFLGFLGEDDATSVD